MNIVMCETKQQLKQVLLHIFFFEESNVLSYEDIRDYLIIDERCLTEEEPYSDEWYDAVDALTTEDLKLAVESENIHMLQTFEPGLLVWMFDNDFDRAGDIKTRLFEYYTKDGISFKTWNNEYE